MASESRLVLSGHNRTMKTTSVYHTSVILNRAKKSEIRFNYDKTRFRFLIVAHGKRGGKTAGGVLPLITTDTASPTQTTQMECPLMGSNPWYQCADVGGICAIRGSGRG